MAQSGLAVPDGVRREHRGRRAVAELDRELRELWTTDAGDRAWWASEEAPERERPEPRPPAPIRGARRGSVSPRDPRRGAGPAGDAGAGRVASADSPANAASGRDPSVRPVRPAAAPTQDRPRPARARAPRRRPAADWLAESESGLTEWSAPAAEPSAPRAERPAPRAESPGPVAERPASLSDASVAVAERSFATAVDRAPGTPRTVVIRGRGAEPYTPRAVTAGRRRADRRYERPGLRPDRTAMWAVVLCLMVLLAAVASAHGAVLPR